MSHYDTLEVSRNASPEVIRAAYRSLIQRYHPDKNPNNAEAAVKAQKVSVAYAILSDPKKRAEYDATLFVDKTSPAGVGSSPNTKAGLQTRNARVEAQSKVIKNDRPNNVATIVSIVVVVVICVAGYMIWGKIKQIDEENFRIFEAQSAKLIIEFDKKQDEKERREREAQEKKATEDEAIDLRRRTLFPFPDNISLNLNAARLYPQQDTVRVLTIPRIGLIIGKSDSERVIANVRQNRDLLIRNVYEKLSQLKESDLITVVAEEHIQTTIQNSMNRVILGDKRELGQCFEGFIEGVFSCRGIQNVVLPQSFSLR